MTLRLGFHSNRLVSHGVCVCVFFVALDKGIKLLGIMKIIGIENLRETNLSFPLPKKYASELQKICIIFLSIFLDVDIRKREKKVNREKDVPRNLNILVCYHTQMCRCKAINHLQPTNFSCIFSIGWIIRNGKYFPVFSVCSNVAAIYSRAHNCEWMNYIAVGIYIVDVEDVSSKSNGLVLGSSFWNSHRSAEAIWCDLVCMH